MCRPSITQNSKKISSNVYITCFNVNRLIPHFNVVLSEILEHSYDVVAITETFLDKTITDAMIQIQGYEIIRIDRERKLGGGVLIYIKSYIKSIVLK